MNTATLTARLYRAVESLRNAEGSLNRVIHLAMGTARSSAWDASTGIERAQCELKLALLDLRRAEAQSLSPPPGAA